MANMRTRHRNRPMEEARYWRNSACQGKQSYHSAAAAASHLRHLITRRGGDFRCDAVIYSCPFCAGYHHANTPRRKPAPTYSVLFLCPTSAEWRRWLVGVDGWGLRGPLRALYWLGFDAGTIRVERETN